MNIYDGQIGDKIILKLNPIYPVKNLDEEISGNSKYFGWFSQSIECLTNTYYLFRPELTLDRIESLIKSSDTNRKYKSLAPINSLFQKICVIADPRIAYQIFKRPRNPDPNSDEAEQIINGGTIVEAIREVFHENIFTYLEAKNKLVREPYKFRLIDNGKLYIEPLYKQANETSLNWLAKNKVNVSEETKVFVVQAVIRNLLTFECNLDMIRKAIKTLTQALRELIFCKFPRTSDLDIIQAKKAIDEAIKTIKGKDNFVTDLQNAKDKTGMTDQEINNAITGIFFAAQDTTMNTMAFLLYHLGKNKIWQDHVFEEWQEWKNQNKTEIDYISNEKTKLHAILQETLRLTPPVYAQMRQATKDFYINDERDQTSTFISQGTALLLVNIFMQRNEQWVNGDEFHPERFLNNERTPAFYPFSVGPNACVGRVFARYEIKSLVLALILNGSWTTTNEKMTLTTNLTLTTVEDIYIDYQPRNSLDNLD